MKSINYLNKSKFFFISILTLSITSCSKDDNATPVNEEELITTVVTTLTNGSTSIILTSRDLDGDGPTAPVVTVSGNLMANTTYSGSVTFLDETTSPPENITEEVDEEGDEHQVFYQLPSNLGTVTYNDFEENGKPIGLLFTYTTGNASTGNLIVTLRHEPNKSASGVASGNISNAGGATDAEVSYPLIIN